MNSTVILSKREYVNLQVMCMLSLLISFICIYSISNLYANISSLHYQPVVAQEVVEVAIEEPILNEIVTQEFDTKEPIDSVEASNEESIIAEVETITVIDDNEVNNIASIENNSIEKTEEIIPVSISYELTEPSNLSAEEINLISETVLENNNISTDESAMASIGDIIYEVEHEYNINAFHMMAIMAHESGYGTSNAAINKNNLVGAMGSNGLIKYDSINESIDHFGSFLYGGYISQGRDSLEEISTKYCPNSSSSWTNKVTFMLDQYIDTYKNL